MKTFLASDKVSFYALLAPSKREKDLTPTGQVVKKVYFRSLWV